MFRQSVGSRAGALVLPREDIDPFRAIARRVAIGAAILLFIATLVWVDRDGYSDIDDRVTFLDAVYYATVSASTTGFGDIAPVSREARLVNTIIITPLRVLFLIVLVGTTLEVATRASRERRRVSRWHRRVSAHSIIIGFGTTGAAAAARLTASGTPQHRVVVVADDPETVDEANAQGFVAVYGDATRRDILLAAAIERASTVIVALPDDATAVLAVLTARQLNPTARIVGAVDAQENAELLRDIGADVALVAADAAGRQLALSLTSHVAGDLYAQLLSPGRGIDLTERPAQPDEVGRLAPELGPVVAVLRQGQVLAASSSEILVEAGDRLVLIVQRP